MGFSPDKLRRYRSNTGLTQAALAERMGARRLQVTAWESGRHTPKVGTVQRIAKALGVDIVDLLDGLDAD